MARKNGSGSNRPHGAFFYKRSKGLKPILVYVSKEVHEELKRLAEIEDRSLQKTVKRILTEFISTHKPRKTRE